MASLSEFLGYYRKENEGTKQNDGACRQALVV
jgi:hypothetical protein